MNLRRGTQMTQIVADMAFNGYIAYFTFVKKIKCKNASSVLLGLGDFVNQFFITLYDCSSFLL